MASRPAEPATFVAAGTPVLEVLGNAGGDEITVRVPDDLIDRLDPDGEDGPSGTQQVRATAVIAGDGESSHVFEFDEAESVVHRREVRLHGVEGNAVVSLAQVAELRLVNGFARIERQNLAPTVTVQARSSEIDLMVERCERLRVKGASGPGPPSLVSQGDRPAV